MFFFIEDVYYHSISLCAIKPTEEHWPKKMSKTCFKLLGLTYRNEFTLSLAKVIMLSGMRLWHLGNVQSGANRETAVKRAGAFW